MYGSYYSDDQCEAAPGVMGHLSCNKSCCNSSRNEQSSSISLQEASSVYSSYSLYSYSKPEFSCNSNYYHKHLEFKEIIVETKTAYLIRTKKKSKNKAFWVPKKLIRNLDPVNKTCLIYALFDVKQIDIY